MDDRSGFLGGEYAEGALLSAGGEVRCSPLRFTVKQGSYRSLKCLKVLEIHHWFFKALKSLKNSTFLVKVLKSP